MKEYGGHERENGWNLLAAFLKERAVLLVLYLAEALVFMMIAGLYDYGGMLVNMWYALWLALFLGLCVLAADFVRYRKKLLSLAQIREQAERGKYLPEAGTGMERLYQEIIVRQEQEKKELAEALEERQQSTADYYTLWTHQIKTPLAAMRLLLQETEQDFAERGDTKGVAEGETFKQLKSELFKTEQYADMALSYARLDSISADLSFQRQDVGRMVKDAVKKYATLFIGSGLHFRMEEFEAYVITDRKWFSFVVEQVLSNALKYTEKGGISIYGADKNGKEKTKNCELIVIEDTGIGIDEGDLPRIFERGFTGYNGRTDKKSTGIGLYLCRQVMDRLGLDLRVESRLGEGTKVFLDIRQKKY